MSLAEVRPAAKPGNIPSAAELIDRARKLAPKLRERVSRLSLTATFRASWLRNMSTPGLSMRCNRSAGAVTSMTMRSRSISPSSSANRPAVPRPGPELFHRSCLHPRAFPEEAQHDVWNRNKAACIATSAAPTGKYRCARRLSARWPLVLVQWLAAFGLDHDRRTCVPRRRRSSRYAALSGAGRK